MLASNLMEAQDYLMFVLWLGPPIAFGIWFTRDWRRSATSNATSHRRRRVAHALSRRPKATAARSPFGVAYETFQPTCKEPQPDALAYDERHAGGLRAILDLFDEVLTDPNPRPLAGVEWDEP